MYTIQESYFKINQIILTTIGLWPYQQSYLPQIHQILFASILLTSIVSQLLAFIKTQYSTDLLFSILPFILPCLFATVKYISFIIQTNSLKKLMEQIRDDWNSLEDKLEIDIIENYANNIKLFTISATAFSYLNILAFVIFQRLPLILDFILPLNESRQYQTFMTAEYFVDQDKYIHVKMLHEFLVIYVGVTIVSGTATTLVIYITHLCALLKIASYRLENATDKNILAMPSPKKQYLLYRRIVNAVVIHQKAVKSVYFVIKATIKYFLHGVISCSLYLKLHKYNRFCEFMTSIFLVPFVILIIIGLSALTFDLFLFFQLMISIHNTSKLLVLLTLITGHLIYLFFANYCGQAVINHGIELFNAVLFVASMDGFVSLTSTAVSYFTVIYSVQQ
ncbi:PREDICTED: uncharacterized protein LOC105559968 isoform X2 [Vollenhovia emeryi]|uniref:uncharacterized protein LOC105559968 isoform X2 n=1 Tax=Vollenhovia emeryi TaxID=411798 RepID=UPI0005F4F4B8|nr:PREDICTED: uncharacterized protein LOC105559968 isoform X2 [Vollenhovia emeryi]